METAIPVSIACSSGSRIRSTTGTLERSDLPPSPASGITRRVTTF